MDLFYIMTNKYKLKFYKYIIKFQYKSIIKWKLIEWIIYIKCLFLGMLKFLIIIGNK